MIEADRAGATARGPAEAAAFIRDAYVSLLARGPDDVGEAYFLDGLLSGAMTEQDVLYELGASPEARGGALMMRDLPGPGETRDCTEPWFNLMMKANGDVYPCCSHLPIGKVAGNVGLQQVIEGAEAERLRQGLLEGILDPWCAGCRSSPVIDAGAFRRKFAEQYFVQDKARHADGSIDLDAHPELRDIYRPGGEPGAGVAIGDRIVLRPGARGQASLRVRGDPPATPSTLVVDVEQDADPAATSRLTIAIDGPHGRSSVETMLTGAAKVQLSLALPGDLGPVELVYSLAATGRGGTITGVGVSHPFFATLTGRQPPYMRPVAPPPIEPKRTARSNRVSKIARTDA
jgi:hypothetical protein